MTRYELDKLVWLIEQLVEKGGIWYDGKFIEFTKEMAPPPRQYLIDLFKETGCESFECQVKTLAEMIDISEKEAKYFLLGYLDFEDFDLDDEA